MGRQMKILQVNKLYPPDLGGVEKAVGQIAEGLCSRTDMKVLSCRKRGPKIREILNGVDVTRSSTHGIVFSMPVSIGFFRDFFTLCKDRDIVHLHMPFPLGDLALFLSSYRGKVVLWWHSDIVRQKKALFFYRPLLSWTLRRADVVIVATRGHIEGSQFLKPYRGKCAIIPFGISDKYLKECVESGESNKPGHKQASEHVEFLFVGRLIYYKGVEVLLEAFAKMSKKNARLTIVGDGPLAEKLSTMASDFQIADKVDFAGKLSESELKEVFRRCDVFVLPSVERSEAFGLVQLEAMAHCKPVINTRLDSGVPYVSLDGETGITVAPGDSTALADAMDILANDEALRISYGMRGRKRVQEEFMASKMLDGIFDLYGKLLKRQ